MKDICKGISNSWFNNATKNIILFLFKRREMQVSKQWVVYLCIIFESMHIIFALPGWRHKCILRKEGGWYFGEGMETNSANEKVTKRKEWQKFV